MNKTIHRTFLAIRRGREDGNDFTLAVLEGKNNNTGILSGRLIEQNLGRGSQYDVQFQLKQNVSISQQNVLATIEVECWEEGANYHIPRQEYERIANQLAHSSEDGDESGNEDRDFDVSQQLSEQQRLEQPPRKRGRPKGSKNRKKNNNKSYSDSDEDEVYEEKKRGRGRPKGSRNKKNIKKIESAPQVNLRTLMGGHIARYFKANERRNEVQDDGEEASEKRGKGRPKGSKNKLKFDRKVQQKMERIMTPQVTEEIQKRNRGRPKGVKNRPREDNESQSSSVFQPEMQIQAVQPTVNVSSCCYRCAQRSKKEQMINSKSIEQIKKVMKESKIVNWYHDNRPQNKNNLALWILSLNDLEVVKYFLQNVNKTERFTRCAWDSQNKLQFCRFTVRTKKQALSRSGKEGMTVLFHDAEQPSQQPWWKIIGIDRILEALPQNVKKQIIDQLKAHNPQLNQALYENIPTLIRCGNFEIAKYLMKDIVPVSYNTYGFSRQHLQCLDSKPNIQKFQYKKINILKQNFCSNFCSPIHCAAINPNSDLLQQLLTNIPDYNVGDSNNMKPVHYAAAAQTKKNLEVLFKHGSDLKDMDKMKMTPLMVAAYHGRAENLQYIMETFNDTSYINFLSQEGYSALHYAVLKGNQECVKILLDNPYTRTDIETKDKQTVMHLACCQGNLDIIRWLVRASAPIDTYDKFGRIPIMFAIRNHNNEVFWELVKLHHKYYKEDSSFNSLLHYAAAYGNIEVIPPLLTKIKQRRNKRNYYPWEVAVGKGHLGCAQLLERPETTEENAFNFFNNIMMLTVKNIDGKQESLKLFRYLKESGKYDFQATDSSGSNLLHHVCNIKQQQYLKGRCSEDVYISYDEMQKLVIGELVEMGLATNISNKRNQTPFKLCVEHGNIVGMRLLLNQNSDLDYESSQGMTILHYLSRIASEGTGGMKFVLDKLTIMDRNILKESLKRVDSNGFQAILFFVRDFTYRVTDNFNRLRREALQDGANNKTEEQVCRTTFIEFLTHQDLFMSLVNFLMDLGCDANVQVVDKRKDDDGESYKKWGIQHFLMKFPSLKLLSLFRRKIRDFNSQNNLGMTALHLFCSWIKKGNLFQIQYDLPEMKEYTGEKSLQFLLENGLNPNILDINRSTPLLYAALNGQISFMILLRRFGSIINNCNNKNQVPLIEVLKLKHLVSLQDIQSILKIGADPNFQDLEKRTSLHHIVYNSTNLDSSPQLCKILFDYNVKINFLDKYGRTPLFYCFTKIDPDVKEVSSTTDRMEILQTLINHKDININHKDVYHRTALHYACQHNYFFSIMHLLSTSLNIDTDIVDYEGNTPLALCLRHRNLNQAALLLKRGAKEGCVVQGEGRYSYFSYAINKMSAGICYMLLDNGYPLEKALKEVKNECFKSQLISRYGKKI